MLGNLKSIETSACGTVDAFVHDCQQQKVCVYLMMLKINSTHRIE